MDGQTTNQDCDGFAETSAEWAGLLARAAALAADMGHAARTGGSGTALDELRHAVDTLTRSVIRPLTIALATQADTASPDTVAGGDPPLDLETVQARLWQLAVDATQARRHPDLPLETLEAVAALQALAVRARSGDSPEAAGELRAIQDGLPARIQAVTNGPYVTTNVDQITDWLGEPLPSLPTMALCRCGRSETKPWCDGSHADSGFSESKDPNRVADRRDQYAGLQLTVFDNRGICQHSGFCTDRLSTVFRQGKEPFVAASGGRMDEIIRAVRDCPSGALSFGMDGNEQRDLVDWSGLRDPAIEVSKDGPYRITGTIPLTDAAGLPSPRNEGVSREHYALCRCGHSQNKPFCSGMHWYVGFLDPAPDPDHHPTIFEWTGGYPALLRMTRLFYEKLIPEDPILAPVFAEMDPRHPQRVATWLSEVFGGPKKYSGTMGGYTHMVTQHIGKGITEDKRARWVQLLTQAAAEAGLPNDPEFAAQLEAYLNWGSRLAVENSAPGMVVPMNMPMPHWDWTTAAGPPWSRIAAHPPAEEEATPIRLPGPGDEVRFEDHIKQLFRRSDRQSMMFAFDLWSYQDVKTHHERILSYLERGLMPCDGKWNAAWVEVLRRWVQTGMHE